MKSLIICCSLFICAHISYCQDSSIRKLYTEYNLRSEIFETWKLDTNGCKMLRGAYTTELEANKHLIGMPKNIFLQLFGNPDYISDKVIYTYVVNAKCDNKKKILEDIPRMELIVLFKNNKLDYIGKLVVD